MYRSILVAIDGSPSADNALRHAVALASALRARLRIVSVVTPLPSFAYRAGVDIAALESEAEKEAVERVRTAAVSDPDDVSVTTHVRSGRAGEGIIAEAQEGDHDLIVLGSRGRGRLASTLLGSVGGDVHFQLRTPLLIVHAAEDED